MDHILAGKYGLAVLGLHVGGEGPVVDWQPPPPEFNI
jgi:hypothetical protein